LSTPPNEMVTSGQLHDPAALRLNKKLLVYKRWCCWWVSLGLGLGEIAHIVIRVQRYGKSCLVPYVPVHYWLNTDILISYLPHSAVLGSLLDSYTPQEQYSYHHSYIVDNTKLSCSTAPYSLQDTDKSSHSCTSRRWHISCRTPGLGL